MLRLAGFAVLVLALAFLTGVEAGEKDKEVMLKGKITCAKCDLAKETTCMTVIVVKEKEKEIVYYFDKDGDKKYHPDICGDGKDGSVVGVTSKKGEKSLVTVKSLEFKK